jgi:small subunit ribosomal protein S2
MEKGGNNVGGLLTIKELLETGVHFGHRVRKWNPKMKPYIYTERKGIHIIDLEKTIKLFEEAYYFVRDSVAQGKEILFVGTKRQVQRTIEEEALRCGAHYVNRRWLGGTLTNFPVIKQRIERMKELEQYDENGGLDKLPKKEAQRLRKELEKLRRNLQGLRNMTRLPDILFVVDTVVESNSVKEAKRLAIPVVAVIDTNCDPDPIDFPIPGNDDAIKATKLIISRIADAVIEGCEGRTAAVEPTKAKPKPEAEATAVATVEAAAVDAEAEPEAEVETATATVEAPPPEPEPEEVAEEAVAEMALSPSPDGSEEEALEPEDEDGKGESS